MRFVLIRQNGICQSIAVAASEIYLFLCLLEAHVILRYTHHFKFSVDVSLDIENLKFIYQEKNM